SSAKTCRSSIALRGSEPLCKLSYSLGFVLIFFRRHIALLCVCSFHSSFLTRSNENLKTKSSLRLMRGLQHAPGSRSSCPRKSHSRDTPGLPTDRMEFADLASSGA